jgi:hypothetical protein
VADATQGSDPTTGRGSAAPPRVRPARIFRTIVMCALAAAPPLGCGSSGPGAEDQQHGRVYRGGPEGDAGAAQADVEQVPVYGISPPDYAVEPPPPVEYGAPYPGPVPDYGVYPAPDNAGPSHDEPVLMYAAPHR